MPFFKGKEEMGLEASLKLLDLPADATIDDANQAYATLHRMIDRFHREKETDAPGDRQEDIELLTCAYEKAVSHLSDQDPRHAASASGGSAHPAADDAKPSGDLHFTINFSPTEADPEDRLDQDEQPVPSNPTVEAAVSITRRRLEEAESRLEAAHQAAASATDAVETANRQFARSRQARITAVVDAKSAEARAQLLEIEADRAMQEAVEIVEKARKRVLAARQTASEARQRAERVRQAVRRIHQSEETAAAEVICAEDRLEQAKGNLRELTHTVVEARRRLRMFTDSDGPSDASPGLEEIRPAADVAAESHGAGQPENRPSAARQQIMADLLELETSLGIRKSPPPAELRQGPTEMPAAGGEGERRRHGRLTYPEDRRPLFIVDGRAIPILDLSSDGMGLAPDDATARSKLVRGSIDFYGKPGVQVTGRVVRKGAQSLGLRLVTRIGNHLLEQERERLRA